MFGKPDFANTFPTANYCKTSDSNIVLSNAIFTGNNRKYRIQAVYETVDGFRTRKLGEIYLSSKNEKWVAELLFTEPNALCSSVLDKKIKRFYNIEEKMDCVQFFTKALNKEKQNLS